MQATSNWQFGLIVAYVLPGFIGLAGLVPLVPGLSVWFHPVAQGFDVGPPVYVMLTAAGVGMVLACFRWILLDQVHAWTGIRRPVWNDAELDQKLGAFDYIVQHHFRYYEFTGNTLIAFCFAYGVNRLSGRLVFLNGVTDLGLLVVVAVLFAASRDALATYYLRTARLTGAVAGHSRGDRIMYNGNDHGATSVKPQTSDPKPQPKSEEAPTHPDTEKQGPKQPKE